MSHPSKPYWYPDWTGDTCLIVASGPSAKQIDLEPAKGKVKCIAINTSWQLAPWADVLYACDVSWWREHKSSWPEFKGLKITQDKLANDEFEIFRVICERHHENLVLDRPGQVGWGGNSGFHCINLAIQFGIKKIILVGYDMQLNGGSHWHGDHPNNMNNPTAANVARWRKTIDANAPIIKSLGIDVFNVSPVSALVNYPKMSLLEALSK